MHKKFIDFLSFSTQKHLTVFYLISKYKPNAKVTSNLCLRLTIKKMRMRAHSKKNVLLRNRLVIKKLQLLCLAISR